MSAEELFFDLDEARASRFVTERDLVRLLRIPRTSLWRLRKSGLPAMKFRRSVRYDVQQVSAWLAANSNQVSPPDSEEVSQQPGLLDPYWSISTALDPKHRPQSPKRPASTVRREWWRYPQEAHLFDEARGRYRRLLAAEVAILQGFPADWGRKAVQDELLLIRGYGDAVPPPLGRAIISELPELLGVKPSTAVEVCAGFGGLALGAKQALELKQTVLIERWDIACEVLRHSGAFNPQAVREADLTEIDWDEFRDKVDLLIGGPPCQPWSLAGRGLGAKDERDLLGTTPQMVARVRPSGFVFENVPGLLSGDNEEYAIDLVDRLRNADGLNSYGVALAVFNAADYGVPQVRKRIFIVGARGKHTGDVHQYFDKVFARRTHAAPHSAAALGLPAWQNISQAVKDWDRPNERWHKWPVPVASDVEGSEMDKSSPVLEMQVSITETERVVRSEAKRLRIGLEWPSRGAAVCWEGEAWAVKDQDDTLASARAVPLLPSFEGVCRPGLDPWLVIGDTCLALDALRRQAGRQARLVYVDLPRIKTNAGSFDATDRERVLDTWLSVARAILRRAISLLDDGGAIAVLCGIDETSYANILLDELAGPQNHVGTIAWQKGYSPRNMPNMREVSPVHDNILIYARRMDALPAVSLRLPAKGFSCSDGDPRGAWKAEQKGANKPDCDYEVHVCPYRWELVDGALPPGLWRVNPKTGVIWGVPTKAGVWDFQLRVTDRAGDIKQKRLHIEVKGDAPALKLAQIPWLIAGRNEQGHITGGPSSNGELRVTSKHLPVGKVGAVYSVCVEAAGGAPWTGTTRPGKTSAGGKGRYWEFPQTTLLARAAEDAVDFKAKADAIPALKTYADGDDRRLNQTTMWFGRARKGGDEGEDPTEVDYSQDAKKEQAALQAIGGVTEVVPTAKPAKLMARLLALFTQGGSTVIDVGSPASEMASLAAAAGRRAVYVTLPPNERLANNVWLPRLRLASQGKHPLPENLTFSLERPDVPSNGYIIDGKAREPNDLAGVYVLKPGTPFAELDQQLGAVSVDYAEYPPGSERFLSALASVEGLVADAGLADSVFASSWNGRLLAVYFSPEKWVERADVEALSQKFRGHLDKGGNLRLYFHRGAPDADRISDQRLELRRVPFSLALTAGVV